MADWDDEQWGDGSVILVEIMFRGQTLYKKRWFGRPNYDGIMELTERVVTDSDMFPVGTMPVRHQFSRFIKSFDTYEDCAISEVEPGDWLRVTVDEMPDTEVTVVSEGTEETEPPAMQSTPSSSRDRVNLNTEASLLTEHNFTCQTVPEHYHPYVFKDREAYDLDAILAQADKREDIEMFFQPKYLDSPNLHTTRKQLVKACGLWLMNNCTKRNYPTKTEKSKMAFSIWKKYPWYGDTQELCDLPFLNFFDPVKQTGFLQSFCANNVRAMKVMRKKLENSKSGTSHDGEPITAKKAKLLSKTRQRAHTFEPMDEDLAIRLMKEANQMKPTGSQMNETKRIADIMQRLQSHRRHWIHTDKSVSPKLILEKYQRLTDCPSLILDDYEAEIMSQGGTPEEFSKSWKPAVPVILKEALHSIQNKPWSLELLKECFKCTCYDDVSQTLTEECRSQLAFMLLPTLIKPTPYAVAGRKKSEKQSMQTALNHLVQFKECGQIVQQCIEEMKKDTSLTQPCLLAFTSSGKPGTEPEQIFLLINYRPILLGKSFTRAIELLYASFHTFFTNYPDGLCQLYYFLELITGIKSPAATGKARELARQVRAFKV